MMSTSASDSKASPSPHIITKETPHPLSVILLGEVVGAHWMGEHLVLYYADKHKALIRVDEDGELTIHDYQVRGC